MNKAAFLDVINHVAAISEQEVAELEKLALSFPYCQTAHLLLAKAAYDHGSMLSNQKLRRAAACAANRQLLKKLIYTSAEIAIIPLALNQEPEPFSSVAANIASPEKTPEPSPVFDSDNSLLIPEINEKSNENILPESVFTAADKEQNQNIIVDESGSVNSTDFNESMKKVSEVSENISEGFVPAEENIDYLNAFSLVASNFADDQENQDSLFLIENLNPAAPFRDPVTDFINNLGYGETEEPPAVEALSGIVEFDNQPELSHRVAKEKISEEVENVTFILRAELPTRENNLNQIELDQTIADFDEYLFRPGTELESDSSASVPFKEEIIYKIFSQNELGYWLGSSRLGETLQLKDELTPVQPYHFQPELILEYSKQHKLESYLPPTEKLPNRQLEIIDQFLKQNPKLKAMAHVKIKAEPMEDLSSRSTKIKKSVASETLANIMVKQGKVKKAIKIYEHLILKIPEKKAYFASQIEKLQKLT